MSKKENATETTTATETKEKAAAGSSIQARCKSLVSAIFTELTSRLPEVNEMFGIDPKDSIKISDLFSEKTFETFVATATELAESVQRGLPLATRLANCNDEINNHYAKLKVVDGKVVRNAVWEAENERLMTKRRNIERAIKAEKSPETASTETAETATA